MVHTDCCMIQYRLYYSTIHECVMHHDQTMITRDALNTCICNIIWLVDLSYHTAHLPKLRLKTPQTVQKTKPLFEWRMSTIGLYRQTSTILSTPGSTVYDPVDDVDSTVRTATFKVHNCFFKKSL